MIRVFKEKGAEINFFLREAKKAVKTLYEEYPRIKNIDIDVLIFRFKNLRKDTADSEEDLDIDVNATKDIIFYNSEFAAYDERTGKFEIYLDHDLLKENTLLSVEYFIHSIFDIFSLNIDSGFMARKDELDECIFEGFSEFNAWRLMEKLYGRKKVKELFEKDKSPTKRFFLLYKEIEKIMNPFSLVYMFIINRKNILKFLQFNGKVKEYFEKYCKETDSFPDISDEKISDYVRSLLKGKIVYVSRM